MSTTSADSVPFRGLITVSIMLATIMQVLDTTIANVALPSMQGSLGAAQDTITWVLTSYIVAAAIATPVTGWVADRIGIKRLFLTCIVGFTLASMLCGLAGSLYQMVGFRILQGIFGAALVPLSQSVLLSINPKERHGQAMAMWGAGIMVGPIIGPTLGGWLTDSFNWRSVFLVNLPVGGLAFAALVLFMPKEGTEKRRFDMFGFALLAIAVACAQLILDRGQGEGWFESAEIWLYLGLGVSAMWMFVVHCATAQDPFIDLAMFKDRNFTSGLVFIFIIGITTFSGLALLPPLLQNLMGYPVIDTGIVMAPRGVGTMLSMIIVGRLVSKVDPRVLVLSGIAISAWSLWLMTGFDLTMGTWPIEYSGFLQGIGLGLVFVPLSTLAFATIRPHHRVDATAMFSLVRNVGQGVGISLVTAVLAHMIQVNTSELASRVTMDAPQIRDIPGMLSGVPTVIAQISGLVQQQAAMIAYLDDFWLMVLVTLASAPIVLMLRRPKLVAKPDPAHAMAE
mgnify:CR=1 FL=1